MIYGDPNEHERTPGTTTIMLVQPTTSSAQPTIPGIVLMVGLVVDDYFAYGLVMVLD